MVISTSHDWLYCVYMVTTNISIFQIIKNTNYKSKSFFFFRFFKICQKSIIFEINKVSWDSIENSIIRLPTECNGQSKGKYSTSKNHIVFLVSPCFNDRPATDEMIGLKLTICLWKYVWHQNSNQHMNLVL